MTDTAFCHNRNGYSFLDALDHFRVTHAGYATGCADYTLATSEYSIPVTGAVRNGLVYGTQFHPEKSGDTGLRMLRAFAEL